jgi:hypothetical protein
MISVGLLLIRGHSFGDKAIYGEALRGLDSVEIEKFCASLSVNTLCDRAKSVCV